MNVGDRVQINVDEPECCNKHGKEGTYMGVYDGYQAASAVLFDDGLTLYFYAHELEVLS